jgi:hypothetical protein
MDKIKDVNKVFIFLVPVGISLSSFVMGYFIVYFTMMEEYIQQYHQYSDRQTEVYFTLTTALLPFAAVIGNLLVMQLPSATTAWLTAMGRTRSSGSWTSWP